MGKHYIGPSIFPSHLGAANTSVSAPGEDAPMLPHSLNYVKRDRFSGMVLGSLVPHDWHSFRAQVLNSEF